MSKNGPRKASFLMPLPPDHEAREKARIEANKAAARDPIVKAKLERDKAAEAANKAKKDLDEARHKLNYLHVQRNENWLDQQQAQRDIETQEKEQRLWAARGANTYGYTERNVVDGNSGSAWETKSDNSYTPEECNKIAEHAQKEVTSLQSKLTSLKVNYQSLEQEIEEQRTTVRDKQLSLQEKQKELETKQKGLENAQELARSTITEEYFPAKKTTPPAAEAPHSATPPPNKSFLGLIGTKAKNLASTIATKFSQHVEKKLNPSSGQTPSSIATNSGRYRSGPTK